MANNVVVFHGVEVTLPPEVSFSHRQGCLEIDMSHGFSGNLLLRGGGPLAVVLQTCVVCNVLSEHCPHSAFLSVPYHCVPKDTQTTRCYSKIGSSKRTI